MMVCAYRTRPVAQLSLQLHQDSIADLLQRLQLNPVAHGIGRPGQVPPPRSHLRNQVPQVHAMPLKL